MKRFKNLDERNKQVAGRVIASMYFLTIAALVGVILYRQLALGQDIHKFEDFAIIMTINSLFLVSALLYYGVFPIDKIRIRDILLVYGLIVVLGSLFTYAKYRLFQDPPLSMHIIFNKILIILAISGLIVIFFLIFSLLGRRRSRKQLED